MEVSKALDPTSTPWAQNGSYPSRPGNNIQILIDGQPAYKEIANAFKKAKKFIYLTISFGDLDFLLVPESEETLLTILTSRSNDGVDVRMVVWQPALHTPDTIPDPGPAKSGINAGPGSIQARWDKAPGFNGTYTSVLDLFDPKNIAFSAEFGCHHQKTYIMDDGEDGYVAFVGGTNPVQTYWDTPAHDSLERRRVEWKYPYPLKWLENNPPLHDIFYQIKGPAVGDVLANFVERFNGATIPHADVTSYVVPPVTADQIPEVPNGIEAQVLRTIAPNTYPAHPDGDTGIRELYLNALKMAAEVGEGSLVYIENQYFFDHGIISEIHEAAVRGAKIIALLTWNPDGGTFL
jgi:phosphatidylserine/phosphatidylglycerophosphate/cardiolipin synthase-like enzyme